MTQRQADEAMRALDVATMAKFEQILGLPFEDQSAAFRRLNEEYDAAADAIIAVAVRSCEKAAAKENGP